MSLVAPLGLAAAFLAGPLVLWYVLRARRPRVEVASTLLWQRADRTAAAAVPWQRFRPDRTFWLVLAAVLVTAVALARPAVEVTAPLGDHTILVIDASASMLADEDGTSRLELARRRAAELVADLGPGQVVSVVEAAATGRVLLSASDDLRAVRRALADAGPTEGRADIADALTLAAALERPSQRTVVHVLSDGVLPDDVAALARPDLALHAVGSDRPNLAVSRLEAVATGGGAAQVFVQVRNLGLVPSGARLTLAVDDAEVVQRTLQLPPRGSEDVVLAAPVSPGAEVVRATVAPSGPSPSGRPATDALPLDDTAIATIAAPRAVTALVATPGNVFLTAALASVEGVEVQTATAVPARLDGVDLLVVDRVAPPPAGTRVPTIYVAPSRQPEGVAATGPPVDLPTVVFAAPGHPLLAEADLSGTAVASAQPVAAPGLEPIVAGPTAPLLLAGRLDATPVLYVTFDLLQSNLPLQVAWPVLVANAVGWLTAPPALAPLQTGDEASFSPPAGATGVVVTGPDGAEVHLDAAAPRLSVDRVGLWRARWAGADDVVGALPPPPALAVNVPVEESDLARDRPPPGGLTTAGAAAAPGTGQRVLGRDLLAAALLLLLADWLLRGRRRPAGTARAAGRGSWRRSDETAGAAGRGRRRPAGTARAVGRARRRRGATAGATR